MCKTLLILFINLTSTGSYEPPGTPARLKTCNAIIAEAEAQDVDPLLAVSVAWVESRWLPNLKNKRSSAIGPLQILPRYWCEGRDGQWRTNGTGQLRGCNLIKGGVRALSWYVTRRKTRLGAIAAYGGTSMDSSYAWTVNHIYERAKVAIE